ncbi:MAG: heavy-metal-associated domain-containing protein [Actinomycetota bacterium]|nr:heavy-metal-associated domain-containing protein [Actinomycetota bacterium]MDA8397400.1 heavy-metal-associated domain-containing protein [Actinomycetota bacterium]
MATKVYRVDGMTCQHCVKAVSDELAQVPGVAKFDVNLDTKLVTVDGDSLDDGAIVAAIDEAGYEALAVTE